MFQFSFRQRILLVFGFALIVLSLSLNRVSALWDQVASDNTVTWNQLTIATGQHAHISSLDETTLVVRSSANSQARLTLFIREDDASSPRDLVKDLCGRDSCVYRPLEDGRLNGAIADYVEGTPFRIVLMHPPGGQIWLEYKGPASEFKTFGSFIDAVLIQMDAGSGSGKAS